MCYNSGVDPARSFRTGRTVPRRSNGGLMSAETLNEETLAMAVGALLSLAFSYIPAWENGTPQGPIRFFVFIFDFLIRF
jgi:hypothetical protein